MAGTRDKVAGAFRSPGPDKHGARSFYLLHPAARFLGQNFKVLGRELVAEFHADVEVIHDDQQRSLRQHLVDRLPAAQRFGLADKGLLHLERKPLRRSDQQRLLVACSVLGLRQQIGGDELGRGGIVRKDRDLAGAGHHVEVHVAVHHPLRGSHVRPAGADDLLHLADRLRAVGHRANGLDAADLVDFVRAREVERIEKVRIHLPVPVRRSARHDFEDARDARQRHGHERGRGQRRSTARDVDADARQRNKLLADQPALRRGDRPILAETGLGKPLDALVRFHRGPLEIGIDCFKRRLSLLLGNGEISGR